MWQRIKALRILLPSAMMWRRILVGCGVLSLIAAAFCWGRWGAMSTAGAQQPQEKYNISQMMQQASATVPQDPRAPVAYIYNSIPITRQELGEYLIARFGVERVEYLVNKRIIEEACKKRGIVVTDAQVEAELVHRLKQINAPSLETFANVVLKKFNKTLYEYKEDVIRPELALAALYSPQVKVTEEELRDAFEAKHGPKVECRMIVLSKEEGRRKSEIWEAVRNDEKAFDDFARKGCVPTIASQAGKVPPIHKHFGDKRIEEEAFRLKPGQVSSIIDMPDGTFIIMKCDKHLPPDASRSFENERRTLEHEVFQIKLNNMVKQAFQALKREADPRIFLQGETLDRNMVTRVNRMLLPPTAPNLPNNLSSISVPPTPKGN